MTYVQPFFYGHFIRGIMLCLLLRRFALWQRLPFNEYFPLVRFRRTVLSIHTLLFHAHFWTLSPDRDIGPKKLVPFIFPFGPVRHWGERYASVGFQSRKEWVKRNQKAIHTQYFSWQRSFLKTIPIAKTSRFVKKPNSVRLDKRKMPPWKYWMCAASKTFPSRFFPYFCFQWSHGEWRDTLSNTISPIPFSTMWSVAVAAVVAAAVWTNRRDFQSQIINGRKGQPLRMLSCNLHKRHRKFSILLIC